MNRLDCDILIVGSGAAGGVLAATLSEATTKRIILLEDGGHYGREFFNQHEWDMRILYAEEGARSTADGAIPVRGGECVGGGTTVNVALSFNPVRAVWDGWRQSVGLQGFSFGDANDYGVSGLSLSAALATVRSRVNVHAPNDAEVNDNNRVLERGCAALGISSRRFELNMRNCVGCGFCAEGCAYDAKQGTLVTFVPDALQRGVRLIHHCGVKRIEFEKRGGALVATGVQADVRPTQPGSRPNSIAAGSLRITAKLVIVSAGSIGTPTLLQRSHLPDPHGRLGAGLVLHPSLPIIGLMDHELVNYRGITGSIYSDHFYQSHGFYYECLFGHPVYGAAVIPGIASDQFDLLHNYRRLAGFGVMLVDSSVPANRVIWQEATGQTSIEYRLSDADKIRLRYAAQKGVEIMFAGGAKEVILPSEERITGQSTVRFSSAAQAVLCDQLQFTPHQTTITSAHCQATVKMSEDPRLGGVNSRGESHSVSNLMVCDSSAFPASCGANPMISIMSMARYQGLRVAAELGRYGL